MPAGGAGEGFEIRAELLGERMELRGKDRARVAAEVGALMARAGAASFRVVERYTGRALWVDEVEHLGDYILEPGEPC